MIYFVGQDLAHEHQPPDLERIVNDELKSGHFRSPEEVIAKALAALREKEGLAVAGDNNGHYENAVRGMLDLRRRTALLFKASRLSN